MVLSTSYLQSLYESKTFDKPNFLHLSKDGVKALGKLKFILLLIYLQHSTAAVIVSIHLFNV